MPSTSPGIEPATSGTEGQRYTNSANQAVCEDDSASTTYENISSFTATLVIASMMKRTEPCKLRHYCADFEMFATFWNTHDLVEPARRLARFITMQVRECAETWLLNVVTMLCMDCTRAAKRTTTVYFEVSLCTEIVLFKQRRSTMVRYSFQEQAEIVFVYGQAGGNCREAARMYDGTPADFRINVRRHLNNIFPRR
ncbi:hypothetical protein ANN_18796 [Periplaneta americana]|uniref:HTH psq-type domain-containing protein n=1 Tax=Periplaneta americana TaxID=6978 RepID=A0ABQ8SPS1_PERAM|nr:hypothetical protein ANN_18796 [Periplaneta americana]